MFPLLAPWPLGYGHGNEAQSVRGSAPDADCGAGGWEVREAAVVESGDQRLERSMWGQQQQLTTPETQDLEQSVPVTKTRSWLYLVFLASAHRLMLWAKYPSNNFFFLPN